MSRDVPDTESGKNRANEPDTATTLASIAALPPGPTLRRRVDAREAALSEQELARDESRIRSIMTRDALYGRGLALVDALAFLGAAQLAALAAGTATTWKLALALPMVTVLAKLLGLYDRDQHKLHKETLSEVPMLGYMATAAAMLAFLAQGEIFRGELSEPGLAALWASLFVLLVAGRATARALLGRFARTERCLVVGNELVASMLNRKFGVQGVNAEVVGALPETDEEAGEAALSESLMRRMQSAIARWDIDRVILTSSRWTADEVVHAIGELKSSGVKVSVLPPISRLSALSFEIDQLPGIALFGIRNFGLSRSSRRLKRAFDLAIASAALLVAAPLMLLIAIAIKLDSPGPVLFRQRRIGRNGEEFEVLKYRSMVDEAERMKADLTHLNEASDLFKITDDPRVTRVGRVIRKLSLDELPQLFNVVRGEMSLVGPRPLIPEEDVRILGAYRRRLDIPPGITGHWQILGSWRVPLNEMATLDYLYVASWSLWRDVKLLVQTIPYVLGRSGT